MRALLATVLFVMTTACATPPGDGTSLPDAAQSWAPHDYSKKEAEILKVVDRVLLAVGNHDAEELDELLITEGVSWFQRIVPDKDNAVEPFRNEDLMSPEEDADPFIERYWSPVIQIRGDLAQVWAPYELRDDGKQIHCGIDAFDLVYLDEAWRVASILSTMEPKSCEGMMPDSPSEMRPRDGWKETPNQ